MNTFPKSSSNPLASLMRQPKLYIRLPSNGEYWSSGSLVKTVTGEYPVYSMTAHDELMLKIPDALLSGQAIVNVIQHCVPNIKNAWSTPSIDIDAILVAIRIATYGDKMTIPVNYFEETQEYEVDLRSILSQIETTIKWNPAIGINLDITAYVRPFTYKQVADSAMTAFETQRILEIASDKSIEETVKSARYAEAFDKLNALTVGMIIYSIERIETAVGVATDPIHIKEFINDCDSEIYAKIKSHIDLLNTANKLPDIKVMPSAEMIEKGAPNEPISVPLTFDPSTFFGKGF